MRKTLATIILALTPLLSQLRNTAQQSAFIRSSDIQGYETETWIDEDNDGCLDKIEYEGAPVQRIVWHNCFCISWLKYPAIVSFTPTFTRYFLDDSQEEIDNTENNYLAGCCVRAIPYTEGFCRNGVYGAYCQREFEAFKK